MTLASRREEIRWGASAIGGKANPNYKSGKYIDNKGYVRVLFPEHPHNICGYVYEHRLLFELTLNRMLESFETIHHINEIKTDNRQENLFLTTVEEHISLHKTGTHKPFDEKVRIRKGIRENRKRNGFRKRDSQGRFKGE